MCVCVFVAVGGNHSVLQLLLDFGCPLATPDVHGAFPLHYAAQEAREPPHDGKAVILTSAAVWLDS